MKVIDILNKIANEEEGEFKFWVKMSIDSTKDTVINWDYKDGLVTQVSDRDNRFLDYIADAIYDLTDEIIIIEEEPEEEEIKELAPLEYIKFNFEQSVNDISNTITYMSSTATTDHDTELLALVINRVIREVEDLKNRLDVANKELEDHKKDLLSHNGSPITLKTIDNVDSSLKFGDTIMVKNDDGIGFIYDDKGVALSKDKI